MKKFSTGVALITAMLITAIAASIAASLATDNALDHRRTSVMLFHDQGMYVAMGAETWGRNILYEDIVDAPDTDHPGELWASELPPLPVDNGTVQGVVTGQMEDLQGRFNINRLVDAQYRENVPIREQFERLLTALEIDPSFAQITVDWIDADQNGSFPNGAEDAIYTGMIPPYRTAGQLLTNASELAALVGMTQADFAKLRPHITALPPDTKINLNTATGPVLQSLSDLLDAAQAESFIEQRENAPFEQADYRQIFDAFVEGSLRQEIGVSSNYFQLKAVVQIDTVRVTYYSVLFRSDAGVSVLQRSQGTY